MGTVTVLTLNTGAAGTGIIGFAIAAETVVQTAPTNKAADKTLRICELPPTSDFLEDIGFGENAFSNYMIETKSPTSS